MGDDLPLLERAYPPSPTPRMHEAQPWWAEPDPAAAAAAAVAAATPPVTPPAAAPRAAAASPRVTPPPAAAAAAAAPPAARLPRPSPSSLDSLCLQLQLAGVLVGAPRREQASLLAAVGWDVGRAVQAFFAAEAAQAEAEEEEEEEEEKSSEGRSSAGVKEERKEGGGSSVAGAAAAASSSSSAAAAAAAPPPRHTLTVESDSEDMSVYNDYRSTRPFAKLFSHFQALAKRPLHFFYRGRQLSDSDTPLSLGMSRADRIEARTPARKRHFQAATAPPAPTPAMQAAADSLAASVAASERSAVNAGAPANKRVKGENGVATDAAANAAAAAVAPAAAAATAAAFPAPDAPAFVATDWHELQLGSVDFSILQTCTPLGEKKRLPERPPPMVALSSFVREMERNQWEAAHLSAYRMAPLGEDATEEEREEADMEDSYARQRNSQLVRLLKALAGRASAMRGTVRLLRSEPTCHCAEAGTKCTERGCNQLHSLRLSLSLLPGAHDTLVPQGNFLLPLLHPKFGELIERDLPPRSHPDMRGPLPSMLDISVRTRYKYKEELPLARNETDEMQEEEEGEEEKEMPPAAASSSSAAAAAVAASSSAAAAAASSSATAAAASSSGAAAAASTPGSLRRYDFAALSDSQRMRVDWGLDPDPDDDAELLSCPQTAALYALSDEELSRRCGLSVTLRDYQQQTVLWSFRQECKPSMAAPYWSEIELCKQRVWYSACLQGIRFLPPPPITGGMNCSEMGLGKTVEMLALIHLNPAPPMPLPAAPAAKGVGRSTPPIPAPAPSVSLAPPPSPAAASPLIPCKCTLIIAPTSLVGQWFSELGSRSAASRQLKVLCWYGSNRSRNLAHLADQDVLLTTFATIAAEAKKSPEESPLHRFLWHRLIVDESHFLKSRVSRQSLHVTALHSNHRWLLSGTPLNTQIDDLFNQFAFFHMPLLSHSHVLAAVRKHVFGKGVEEEDYGPRECFAILERMLQCNIVRHKKVQRFNGRDELVSLPPRSMDTIRVAFSPEERQAYDQMYSFAQARFRELQARRSTMSQHVQLMSLLSPLRQACSAGHHDLEEMMGALHALAAAETARMNEAAASGLAELRAWELQQPFNLGEDCTFCMELPEDALMTSCRHVYCRGCILQWCNKAKAPEVECPLCRTMFKKKELKPPPERPAPPVEERKESLAAAAAAAGSGSIPSHIVFNSKVDALLTQLHLIRRANPATKSLVFSHFTQTINIVSERLKQSGLKGMVLKGNLTMPQRREALDQFINDPSCTVLVLSIRAGAVGLTLTAATELFVLEPSLSPALTQQAINRVHRVGQTKPVRIHHLVMEGSVEEQILALTQQQLQERGEEEEEGEGAHPARGGRRGAGSSDKHSLRSTDLATLFA